MEGLAQRRSQRPESTLGSSPTDTSTSTKSGSDSHPSPQAVNGQFLYGDLFLAALLPPALVMLAFGGRPMLIVICFGSMFTYIFDLFGAMETTVLSIVVTLMCLWGTLIYAARFLLQDSFLNFGIIFILTILISLIFFALAGQFRALRIEFESSFYFIETILMATIPLISSTILTWFIAVEFPTLDLAFAFSVTHFLYIQLLLHPRPTSHPSAAKTSVITHWGGGPYVLTLPMVVAVYLTPIILCPALHITMHHTVAMSSSLHKLLHFGLSCLFPIMTIILSAERQLQYWPESERPILGSLLFFFKMITTFGLAVCLQTNEILEDLKDFSGLQEPSASIVSLLIVILLLGAFVLNSLIPPRGELMSNTSQISVLSGLLDACIAASVILTAGLLGVIKPRNNDSIFVTIAILVGSGCLTELYRGEVVHVPTKLTILKKFIYATLASGMLSGGLHLFTLQHLQHLDLTISWQGFEWTIQTLCLIGSLLAGMAVTIPILLRKPNTKEFGSLGYVPGVVNGPTILQSLTSQIGSLLLISFCAGTAAFEMLLRDQDWSEIISTSDYSASSASSVYSSSLFVTSAFLFSMAAAHLYSLEVVSASTLTILIIIQICKLLHLLDVESSLCASAAFLLISLSLPFVVHLSSGWVTNKIGGADIANKSPSTPTTPIWSPTLTVLETVYYPLGAAIACYSSSFTLLPLIFTTFSDQHSSPNQSTFSAAAIWLFFTALFVLIYWRSATLLRSVLFLLGGFCCLVATNALGQFNIRYDPSSPLPFTIEILSTEMKTTNTFHIYHILTIILAFSAFAGLLPVRSLFPRLLFVAVFTYFSAKALEQIAFPFANSPEVVTLDDGIFGLPWLSCLTISFLGTSTVLNSSSSSSAPPPSSSSTSNTTTTSSSSTSSKGNSGQWMMTLFVASPIFFFLWVAVEESYHLLTPLCLATSLAHILVAICSRLIEFARQHDPIYLSHSSSHSIMSFAESVCIISSCVGFVFGAIACWFTRHLIFFDFTIPLLSLVFYTTSDGSLIPSTPALGVSATLSALWWILSALHSLFLKGHDGLQFLHNFRSSSSSFLLDDADLSIWNENDEVVIRWNTLLHIGLLLVTLPGVILSFLRRKNESEDLMFVLAAVSLLAGIISQIWSLRLLGIVSALYAAWRCYDIGQKTRKSDQTI